MAQVTIYTDGACSGNPGPGGWAAILISGQHQRQITGAASNTTNNEMELTAVLQGLLALKGSRHQVAVMTDSQNVIGWLAKNWKRKTARLMPLLNAIEEAMKSHQVTFSKVAAHNGDKLNELADRLAKAALKSI